MLISGLPLYWASETSGELAKAVKAYFDNPQLVTAHQLTLLRKYLVIHISADCWRNNPHARPENIQAINSLIAQAEAITQCQLTLIVKVEDIMPLVDNCLKEGIDPF